MRKLKSSLVNRLLTRAALLPVPEINQLAFGAVNGIEFWRRKFGDVFVHFRAFAGQAFVEVPIATFGIAADNGEVLSAAVVFVRDAGGDDDDVAGVDAFTDAVFAAKLNTGFTARNGEGFMSGAVVVMEIVNVGDPVIAPIVGSEQFLEKCFGFGAGVVSRRRDK